MTAGDFYDSLETRDPAAREAALMAALSKQVANAKSRTGWYATLFKDVDPRAVHDFFSFGYVQPPRSIYSQVRSLGPGKYMHVSRANIVEKSYWKPRFHVNERLTEAEWIEETRARVMAAPAKQPQAVPISGIHPGISAA